MNSLVLFLSVAAVASLASTQLVAQRYPQILRMVNDVSPDGRFQYGFQTEDGISVEAHGEPVAASAIARDVEGAGPAVAITGQYSYTGPDGQVYTVSYVADENGFHPSGAHLPQPPPIPEAIQRSLGLTASSPQPFQQQEFRRF